MSPVDTFLALNSCMLSLTIINKPAMSKEEMSREMPMVFIMGGWFWLHNIVI